MSEPTEAKAPNSKPWYKNWKMWAVIVVVLIIISRCGGDDDAESDETPASTQTTSVATDQATPEATEESTATTTEEATPEPTEEAPEAEEPPAADEVEIFTQRILDSGAYPSWSEIRIAEADLSGDFITVDRVQGDTVFLKVQASLAEEEKVALGRWMFTMSGQDDYDTFVVTDTSGRDQNVFCSSTSKVCATSIWDT